MAGMWQKKEEQEVEEGEGEEEKNEGEEEEERATTKVSVLGRMAEAASNWEEEVLWKPTKANS